MFKFLRCENWFCRIAACIVALELLLLIPIPQPLGYVLLLNSLGPSTAYYNPQIATALQGPDGRKYVFLGDDFYVWISVVRHERNGNCYFHIHRYAEATDGPDKGKPKLISEEGLQFVGRNELRQTRWPQPPTKLVLQYELDEEGNIVGPLLPDGVEEQETDFYVVGRYYCNALDYIFPRYIQGGSRNETGRVHAVIKRTKPSWATELMRSH